ncbi:amidohydrolase family protein [Actinomycetospora cinnamomea]|uniref:amidohydrolase family protein n=1 Tax=Actinomycetospora cinnamomea TaxID=663609 RepID=UPI003C303C31
MSPARDPLVSPPVDDADVPTWVAATGVDGLVDLHVHFLPDRMLQKVWAYFDDAEEHYGRAWPIHYREPEQTRLDLLRGFGVRMFAPLVYPHKPDMAAWLTSWALEWAAEVPEAVPTATLYPEESVTTYLGDALDAGARVVKAHVQVGAYDPRDPLLDRAWGLVAEAGVPVIVHCGDGPIPGAYTGMDVFAEVLARHPRLTAVLAHAGLPEYDAALGLLERFENVHLDTTMVGTPFTEAFAPVPPDWPARLVAVADRVLLGTDFPNIPYGYHEQLAAIASWAAADDRLGAGFLRSVLHDAPARLVGRDGPSPDGAVRRG